MQLQSLMLYMRFSGALGNIGGAVLFLVSDKKKDFFSHPCNTGLFLDPYNYRWLIAVFSSDAAIDATKISSISYVKKLEELPFIICHVNKKRKSGKKVNKTRILTWSISTGGLPGVYAHNFTRCWGYGCRDLVKSKRNLRWFHKGARPATELAAGVI
ncbi:hypothetical protein Droror1_Dr00019965 [Drosera rotundifolia]